MPNSSTLNPRSSICKILQKAVKTVFLRLLMLCAFLIVLLILSGVLSYTHSSLWLGKPSEVVCQNVNSTRIDCTLTYQAILRSSEQEIKDVQGLNIVEHISSSDNEKKTKYVATLRSQSGNYPVKTYFKHNSPELEVLNHRLNKFIKNPVGKLTLPVQHNLWETIVSYIATIFYSFYGLNLLFILLFIAIFILVLIVQLIKLAIQLIKYSLMQILLLIQYFKSHQHRESLNRIKFKMRSTIIQLWQLGKYQRDQLFMTTQSWRNRYQLPHTHFLLAGLAIGYVGFVWWLGIRTIVLLSGAVIVGLAIISWYKQLHSQRTTLSTDSANLLQADVFLNHLGVLDRRIPDESQSLWQSVRQQAEAIQRTATQTAQQESTFTPDLLETLHTVLELADQLVQALQVTQQVQTPRYQELAQQQLQSSRTRLQQTHDQLQELHDQMALENLKHRSLTTPAVISTRLQTLIAENERAILGD